MKTDKSGDPTASERHVGGARFVPVSGTFGTEAIIPGPMTAGPPKPEPEDEHWTLPPVRAHDLPAASSPVEDDAEPRLDDVDGGP
jgi:hypothetical protein